MKYQLPSPVRDTTRPRVMTGLAIVIAALLVSGPGWSQAAFFKNSDAPRLPPLPAPTAQQLQNRAVAQKELAREVAALHLTALRPGRDPRNPDAANAANYDEAEANPHPVASDVLRMADGKETATADEWWKVRRPQILAAFTKTFYGEMPKTIPSVTWHVVGTTTETVGGVKAVTRHLVGHVDNSADPAIKVDIAVDETLPANTKTPVPLIVNFIYNHSYDATRKINEGEDPPGPDWRAQILTHGWGYAAYDPLSVQADNGAGLDKGIIGLVNKGKPRDMNQWGAVRAWAWGASRVLDYLWRDPKIRNGEIGIAGHSRFGKAALVAMAYDERFAIGYISSSGAGAAKILRRNYGETLENLATADEFHWFAGNFLKYAADPLSAADLPVDGDALIALCAPRPIFIGAGSSSAGDAWTDARGMFMGAVGAGPVYKLLGKQPLETETFPPMGTALLAGDIAYRQHQYNHNPAPNWPYFLTFAQKYLQP